MRTRNPIGVISLSLVLAAGLVVVSAHAQKKGRKTSRQSSSSLEKKARREVLPLRLVGELPGQAASDPSKQSEWPSIAYAADGSLYIAFIEWNDRNADRLLVRRRDPQGHWAAPVTVDDGNWDHYWPAVTADGDNALVVWSAQVGGNFELYSAEIQPSGRVSRLQRLTRAPHGDFNARLAGDGKGNATLVWQSFRNGNADIYAMRRSAGRWGKEIRISTSERGDWEPSVAVDPRGIAWISWDTYHHGNYDVMLRSLEGDQPGPPIAITTEPEAQFHSTVAADQQGRVWVAWDHAGPNWGKDFSRSSAAPGSEGLHARRGIGIRVYVNGRLREPSADLQAAFSGRMKTFAELPQLAFDGAGALWLIFRHWTYTSPNEIYHVYATRLADQGWSLPWRITPSSGRNSQYTSVALSAKGNLTLAYAGDGRSETVRPTDQAHALHYVTSVSELPRSAEATSTGFRDVTLPAPSPAPPLRQRQTLTVAGKTYTLLLGDCHRHTDIRGHSGVDGSVLDTYRYAIDAAQLDFLGVSDHNEVTGGRWPDGLRDYQWWWVQKAVDLFTHAPTFIGVYSYEHSMNRPGGHRNVLFLKRGAPLRMIDREKKGDAPDNQPPAMWEFWRKYVLTQPGQKSVIVPHTFAAGPLADWNWPNPGFDCLLEIYQGCRGSYEAWRLPEKEKRGPTQTDEPGHFAQDALAKGNIYGFVSFSDHSSTHNSWAAVWTLKQDREGLIDAMLAKRTYAASDEIILRATAGGRMMGEEFSLPAGRAPRIEASITAPDTILRVDVVKDGKYVYTIRPDAKTATLNWQDTETRPGKSYYYLRVFQRDTEKPDGDPEIAWSSPFYVTYR